MNLDAFVAQLNQQNEDIARIGRDLKKDQIKTVVGAVGFTVGYAVAFVVTLKHLTK